MRSIIAVTLLAAGLAAVSADDALAAYTSHAAYCAENGADVDVNEQGEGTMSLSACADACDDRSGCTAFEYDDSGNCMTTVNSAINSGTGGSDADCYIMTSCGDVLFMDFYTFCPEGYDYPASESVCSSIADDYGYSTYGTEGPYGSGHPPCFWNSGEMAWVHGYSSSECPDMSGDWNDLGAVCVRVGGPYDTMGCTDSSTGACSSTGESSISSGVSCDTISSHYDVSQTCSSSGTSFADSDVCIVVVENSAFSTCREFSADAGSTCVDGSDSHGGSCDNVDQTDDEWGQGCDAENCGDDCICMCSSNGESSFLSGYYIFEDTSRGEGCDALSYDGSVVSSWEADHCCDDEPYCCGYESCGAGSDECGYRFRCNGDSDASDGYCSQAWCTSTDGHEGYDCMAGTPGEACTCSQGTAKETGYVDYGCDGEESEDGEVHCYEYTCCTDGSGQGEECGDCTSPHTSNARAA